MPNQIYPPESQLNRANASGTEAPFLDLHISMTNGFVSSKINDKRDDFDISKLMIPITLFEKFGRYMCKYLYRALKYLHDYTL